MKTSLLIGALAFVLSGAASAQTPAAPVDQVVQDINADWGAMEVAKNHLLKDLQTLVTDREKLKADLKAATDKIATLEKEKAAAPPPK